MPTGIRCRAEAASGRHPPWPLLIGYNAPFALWTAYALCKPLIDGMGGVWCPIHALLGWCPACGTTGEYAALLYAGHPPGLRTGVLLAGFIVTAGWSIYRCRRHEQRRMAAPS